MAKIYRSPNVTSIGSSYTGPNNLQHAVPHPQSFYGYSPRIDFNLNQKDHFFYKHSISHYTVTNPDYTTTNNYGALFNGRYNLVMTGAWDHTFSLHLLITTTASYNRYNGLGSYPNVKGITSAALGLPSYLDTQENAGGSNGAPATATVSGYATPAVNGCTTANFLKTLSANSDLVGVFGRHALKFGATFREYVWYQPSNGNTTLSYDNTYTDISSNSSSYLSTGASQLGAPYAAFLRGFNSSR